MSPSKRIKKNDSDDHIINQSHVSNGDFEEEFHEDEGIKSIFIEI